MSNEPATQLLESLWAIYSIEQIGSRYLRQLDRAAFMTAAEPLMREFSPAIFAGGQVARRAICMFFYHLNEETQAVLSLPLAWQRAFRDAFDRGEIDSVALGAAVRMIYRYNSPEPRYAGEAMAETLANLRLSDPAGIMLPQELRVWHALPDHVTIYRGALAHTAAEAARGISWSLSRGYSAMHLYRRAMPIHAATDVRALLGLDAPPRQLVSATVRKSAVLAAMCSSDEEVFVDYEQIETAGITSLPTSSLLTTGFKELVQKTSARLHAA
ncbi:MAG TPA: hypothetical protein VM662_14030 [Sphingomonas sp.]|nr:hypothetical protein [Sphingomonas sp.]